ncbi:MAG TPA: histidine kinase, partial [Chitinophagaceae bacterium]|nr:histidine kinase [Chitinophagaceae bacterium]
LSKQLLLSDSLSSEKVKINSNYLHIKNKIEQKENLIKQQENTIRKNKTIQYLMAGGIFLIILLAMLGYKYYRQRKKNQEQRIQELETEKQLLSTQSLLKGQEEERSRIAKDLHDGLGGLLSGVKLQLG